MEGSILSSDISFVLFASLFRVGVAIATLLGTHLYITRVCICGLDPESVPTLWSFFELVPMLAPRRLYQLTRVIQTTKCFRCTV